LLAILVLASNPAGVAVFPGLPEVLKNQTYLTMTVRMVIFCNLIIMIIIYRTIDIGIQLSEYCIVSIIGKETQKKINYVMFYISTEVAFLDL
jgi:hypothetical protein